MSYTVPFSDYANKLSLTVEDGTLNQQTSLKIPGRNSISYGSAIAENFLHLLENFANRIAPDNPVEGQLWFDSTLGNEVLMVFNGVNWIPASGIKKAISEPEAGQSLLGDLWVDTDNQQLYLYSGSGWVLVGPEFSEGLVTGVKPASILGTDDKSYNILQFEVASKILGIATNNAFTPKVKISGFTTLKPGLNLSKDNIAGEGLTKYTGTAETAENLIVAGISVAASNFLRSDVTSNTFYPINVQNNGGINYGINSELNIGVENNAGVISHNIAGSHIDIKVKNDNRLTSLMRIDSALKVGINNIAPEETLDVLGNFQIGPTLSNSNTGNIIVNSTVDSLTLNTGSITTLGGVGIGKNLNVGGAFSVGGSSTVKDILPDINSARDVGTSLSRFRSVYSTNFYGNVIGNVSGTVTGLAGSAEKLSSPTTFTISGDVVSDALSFDGQAGGTNKIFNTTLANTFISSKDETSNPNYLDELIINRIVGDTGVKKINLQNLLSILPKIPIGTIVPFAGITSPQGWLICDGQEIEITTYPALFNVIAYTYRAENLVEEGFFAIPDLRGRFLLGKDDMGTFGSANSVAEANLLGAKGGSKEVGLQTSNLPEHKHNLEGDSGDQYYALRDISGSPTDDDAIVYDAPTGLGAGQALSNSGGILTNSQLGQPFNILNPYITLNYIIYFG